MSWKVGFEYSVEFQGRLRMLTSLLSFAFIPLTHGKCIPLLFLSPIMLGVRGFY